MGLYLFFGAYFDFMKANSPVKFFWRYSFMIPFFAILLLYVFIFLMRTKKGLLKVTFFLNLLFIVYIFIDILNGIWKATHPLKNKLAVYDFAKKNTLTIPDSCARPDLYFLLFDEYASSASLKVRYNFNNDIDSFLMSKGFSLQSGSVSNYNYTPFSIASILNMSYLEWLKPELGVNRQDFLQCNPEILQNHLLQFLGTNGYNIVNLSMFDLAGHPSRIRQSFLPVKTKMIAEGTLFPRIYRDFEWFFLNNKFLSNLLQQDYLFQHIGNNEFFISEILKESMIKSGKPRFIYAHLYMPHEPFFYDENGIRKDNETVVAEYKARSPRAYLQYVQYTNKRMKDLINTLLVNTKGNAAIIILGDHGFRSGTAGGRIPLWHFQNLNAVYFPNKDYSRLYDSISNVNEFRVVLNTLFDQQLPMLKDSIVYLVDRK